MKSLLNSYFGENTITTEQLILKKTNEYITSEKKSLNVKGYNLLNYQIHEGLAEAITIIHYNSLALDSIKNEIYRNDKFGGDLLTGEESDIQSQEVITFQNKVYEISEQLLHEEKKHSKILKLYQMTFYQIKVINLIMSVLQHINAINNSEKIDIRSNNTNSRIFGKAYLNGNDLKSYQELISIICTNAEANEGKDKIGKFITIIIDNNLREDKFSSYENKKPELEKNSRKLILEAVETIHEIETT